MKLLNLSSADVLARAQQRGHTPESIEPCIVERKGDRWVVDIDHPAYPRGDTPKQVAERFTQSVPMVQKAINFSKAAVKHAVSGLRKCTDEEIAARFAICSGCEFYQDGACAKCGCPILRQKKLISKLAWADQSCPVGKWAAIKGNEATDK